MSSVPPAQVVSPVSPLIVAHRGASGDHPENTIAAFDAAIAVGAGGLEFDVQLTSDGVPVVYHDRTLHKIAGLRARIHELSWPQLRLLDAGAWFDPRFRGARVPRLDTVLDRYGGRVGLMVEIKLDGERSAARRMRLVDACIEALMSRNLADSVFVLSFDAHALRRVQRRAPGLRCVLDLEAAPSLRESDARRFRGLHAVCMPARAMRRRLRAELARIPLGAWVYRCDTDVHLARARRWALDAIITDWPDWAGAAIRPDPA